MLSSSVHTELVIILFTEYNFFLHPNFLAFHSGCCVYLDILPKSFSIRYASGQISLNHITVGQPAVGFLYLCLDSFVFAIICNERLS